MKKSFEESIAELDNIVEGLEGNKLSLEESIKEFARGMELIKDCRDTLTKARQKVMKIMADGEAEEFGEAADD
ncbi:MAG: exodeoxyribonuclease VII small subunit [Clostridia bacterium]|nr:exodeoxyribonuclease VII small subunit [Clostridia bacterium]